MPVCCECCVL